MIAFLKGKLAAVNPSMLILDVHGVGYRIFIAPNCFTKLPLVEEEVQLHTVLVIREQAHSLYGFLSVEERDFFESLLNVTGIGPKTALSLIGHLDLPKLYQAIAESNVLVLSKVPGIGKKTAERLVIELRDKVPSTASAPLLHSPAMEKHALKVQDALQALVHLGYSQQTAEKAVKHSLKDLPEAVDLAELITTALRHASGL